MAKSRADKKKKHTCASTTDSNTTLEESDKKKMFVGCPVADPIICCMSKCEVDPEEGISMICTNEACPYANVKLHPQCFAELESSLVKRLRTLGSARDWNDAQRRNNLWEKKGLALVGKFCRCRCGLGQTRFDRDAAFEKEKAMKREAKKEKKKKNHLPQLQFTDESRKLPIDNGKSSRSRDYSCTSDVSYSTSHTANDSQACGESNGRYRNMDFNFKLENLTNDVFTSPPSPDIIPAPLPPQQTRSYASLIKSDNQACLTEEEEPSHLDSGLEQDNRTSSAESINFVKPESEESGVNATNTDEINLFELLSPIPHNPCGHNFAAIKSSKWYASEESQSVQSHMNNVYPFTSTPRIKRTNRRGLPSKMRTSTSSSSTAIQIKSEYSSDDEPRCAIVFNKPAASESKKDANVDKETSDDNKKEDDGCDGQLIYGWTPLFGHDFNLGERLMFLP